MILGMPNLAGSIIACFLDNTVPGKAFCPIVVLLRYSVVWTVKSLSLFYFLLMSRLVCTKQ